jgi:hypothetical protein
MNNANDMIIKTAFVVNQFVDKFERERFLNKQMFKANLMRTPIKQLPQRNRNYSK